MPKPGWMNDLERLPSVRWGRHRSAGVFITYRDALSPETEAEVPGTRSVGARISLEPLTKYPNELREQPQRLVAETTAEDPA